MPVVRLASSGRVNAGSVPGTPQDRNNPLRTSSSTGRVGSAPPPREQLFISVASSTTSPAQVAAVASRAAVSQRQLTPLSSRRCIPVVGGLTSSPARRKKAADDPPSSARGPGLHGAGSITVSGGAEVHGPGNAAARMSARGLHEVVRQQSQGQIQPQQSQGAAAAARRSSLRSSSAKALSAGRIGLSAAPALGRMVSSSSSPTSLPASARGPVPSRSSTAPRRRVGHKAGSMELLVGSSWRHGLPASLVEQGIFHQPASSDGSVDLTTWDDSNCSRIADAALWKSTQLLEEMRSLTSGNEESRVPMQRLCSPEEQQDETYSIPSRIVTPTLPSRMTWPPPGMQREVAQEMAEIWRAVRDIEQRLGERSGEVSEVRALESSLSQALQHLQQVAQHAPMGAMQSQPGFTAASSASCCSLGSPRNDKAMTSGPATPISTTSAGLSSVGSTLTPQLRGPWSVGSTLTPQQSSRGSISIRDGASIVTSVPTIGGHGGFDGFASPAVSSVGSMQTHVSPRISFGSRQLQRGSLEMTPAGSSSHCEVVRRSSCTLPVQSSPVQAAQVQSSPLPKAVQATPVQSSSSSSGLPRPAYARVSSPVPTQMSGGQVVWQPVVVTKVHQYLAWAPQQQNRTVSSTTYVQSAGPPAPSP